ncbi:hypothetical protein ACHHYP_04417, partial [Achlya hypogyna]
PLERLTVLFYHASSTPLALPLVRQLATELDAVGCRGHALAVVGHVLAMDPTATEMRSQFGRIPSSPLNMSTTEYAQLCSAISQQYELGHLHEAYAQVRIALVVAPSDIAQLTNAGAISFQVAMLNQLGTTDELCSWVGFMKLCIGSTVYEALGDRTAALECYDRALSLQPEYPEALYNYGNALLKAGEVNAVVDLNWRTLPLATFVTTDLRKNPRGLQALVSLLLAELPAAAVACAQRVLAADFNVAFSQNRNLQELARRTGSFDRSLTLFSMALTSEAPPAEVYDRVAQCIEQPSPTSGRQLVHLIVQYFTASSSARQAELAASLRRNVANAHIASVHVLVESAADVHRVDEATRDLHPRHLHIHVLGRRLRFRDAFAYANALPPAVWIVANADVYFDASVELLQTTPLPQRHVRSLVVRSNTDVVALTRWEIGTDGKLVFYPRIDSQDAWVFATPLPPHLVRDMAVPLGYPRSDSHLAYRLGKWNYGVSNWGLFVRAVHLHATQERSYVQADTIPGLDRYVRLQLLLN